MNSPAPPAAVDLKGVRFYVREAIKALQEDIEGERMYQIEKNLRSAAALLNQT